MSQNLGGVSRMPREDLFNREEAEKITNLIAEGKTYVTQAAEAYKRRVASKKKAMELATKYINGEIEIAASSGAKSYKWSFDNMKDVPVFVAGPTFQQFVFNQLFGFFSPYYSVTIAIEAGRPVMLFDLSPFYETSLSQPTILNSGSSGDFENDISLESEHFK